MTSPAPAPAAPGGSQASGVRSAAASHRGLRDLPGVQGVSYDVAMSTRSVAEIATGALAAGAYIHFLKGIGCSRVNAYVSAAAAEAASAHVRSHASALTIDDHREVMHGCSPTSRRRRVQLVREAGCEPMDCRSVHCRASCVCRSALMPRNVCVL